MKKIIIIALSLTLLSIVPGAWAGMGGGRGGGHMGGGMMMDGGRPWGGRLSPNMDRHEMDRYEREDRARRRFEEDTRSLRRSINQKQDALDRELDRRDPDMNRIKQLNRDLSRLRDEMGMEQRRYEQFRQEEAGRYDNRAYPRNW